MSSASPRGNLRSYNPRICVARPIEERGALTSLQQSGIAFIEGPVRSGKSWFVHRLVEILGAKPNAGPARLAPVNWAALRRSADGHAPSEALADALYAHFASQLIHALRGPREWLEVMRDRQQTNARRLTKLLSEHILPSLPGVLVIAFEHIDDLSMTRLGDELSELVRSWFGTGKPKWPSLRLVVEAESLKLPGFAAGGQYGYMRNLTTYVPLGPFRLAEAMDLMARHGLDWEMKDVQELVVYTGGHPYLLQLAAAAGAERGLHPSVIVNKGIAQGVFAEHLTEIRSALDTLGLRQAANELVTSRPRRLPEGLYLRLARLGLVDWTTMDAAPRLMAPIYEQLVKGMG